MSALTQPVPRSLAPARSRPRRRLNADAVAGMLFVLPAVLLVGLFFLAPLVMTGWMSLHNWPLMGVPRFVGAQNYLSVARDVRFWHALAFTVEYTLVVTVAIFAVAFPLAASLLQ